MQLSKSFLPLAFLAAGAIMVEPGAGQPLLIHDDEFVTAPRIVPSTRSPATGVGRRRRSKGAQAKRARRPNRLTVGRRVRRKHRRAA